MKEAADELEAAYQWDLSDAPACECDCWKCQYAETYGGEHCKECEEES